MSLSQGRLYGFPSGNSKATRLEPPEVGQERWIDYHLPHLDPEEVCSTLNCHKAYELQAGHIIHSLPKFCDFTTYGGLTEDEEYTLCELEARRLVHIANSNAPVELQGQDGLYGPATQEGYLRLHWLGQRLSQSFEVCKHDVAMIDAENLNSELGFRECAHIQAKLLEHFDTTTGEERYSNSREAWDENSNKRYHAIIEYLTAILVKVVLQTFRGDYWVHNVVAAVARIAAKAKILGNDIPRAVELTLQKSDEARLRIHRKETLYERYALKKPEEWLNASDNEKKTTPNQVGQATRYFLEMNTLYTVILNMLIGSLAGFAISNPFAPGPDEFESCVALYESFVTDEQVLLCEQKDGAIGAASAVGITRAFTAGFQVCLQSWETLEREPADGTRDKWTSIQWKWSPLDQDGAVLPKHKQDTLKFCKMKNIIAATIPYAIISGTFASDLNTLVDLLLFTSGRTSKSALFLIRPPKAVCSAILRTSTYVSRRPGVIGDGDALPLSETFLLRERAFANKLTGTNLNALYQVQPLTNTKNDITLRDREKSKAALHKVMKEVEKWIVDDECIIIPYKQYAWGTLATCGLLVIGGLLVGFLVGDRITGVDPFNISVFCWVLAGFLLVIAKAIRVEYWPWSQFLRGEVPCRSINEVIGVTGVHAQVLLAILLRRDNLLSLRTRGPYNTAFLRRTENGEGGFSIDVPIRTATAIEGGLIPVKVMADWGPTLVFIDTHSWASYNVARNTSYYEGQVFCRDITHPTYWTENIPRYRLETGKVQVSRVLGIFQEDCYFY